MNYFKNEDQLHFILNFQYDVTEPAKTIGSFDDFDKALSALETAIVYNAIDNQHDNIKKISDLLVEHTLPSEFSICAMKKNEFSLNCENQLRVFEVIMGENSFDEMQYKGKYCIVEQKKEFERHKERTKHNIKDALENEKPNWNIIEANKLNQNRMDNKIKDIHSIISPEQLKFVEKTWEKNKEDQKNAFLYRFEQKLKNEFPKEYQDISKTIESNQVEYKAKNKNKPK